MKTIIKLTLAAVLTAGTIQAFAQDDPLARLRAQREQEQQQLGGGQPADAGQAATPAPDAAAAPGDVAPASAQSDAAQQTETSAVPEQAMDFTVGPSTPLSTNGITFNFRNAPLDAVLTYMSDAAGFIIVLDTPVRGNVSIIGTHPMTKDEAVDVLNSVLNQNGLAAIREDRTLTIMSKADAGHQNIPVKEGNIYTNVPKNAEIVTQIIPIRFVDAEQLVVDISPFTEQALSVVANQAGNSIIVTDTQANIRHLMQIIQSIDDSAQMETEVHVFTLKYANPNDVVAMLSSVFPSSTGGAQTTINIGGGRGGRGGGFGGGFGGGRGGGAAGGTSAQRIQKAQQVLAVADGRTQSVIVTAAKDMMPQIKEMIDNVDIDSTRDQNVSVVHLDSADPYQAAQALQSMFQSTTAARTSGSTGTDPLQIRQTQMQNSTTTSGFGGTTGGGARGGGGGGLF